MSFKKIYRPYAVGLAFVLVLLIAGNAGAFPSLVETLLSPGLVLASVLKLGAHDLATIGVVLVVDSALYGAAVLLVLVLIRSSLPRPR